MIFQEIIETGFEFAHLAQHVVTQEFIPASVPSCTPGYFLRYYGMYELV
jgi:hypothetical protein